MFINSVIKPYSTLTASTLLVLALLLAACSKPAETSNQAVEEPRDPNIVELSEDLQRHVKIVPVGKAEIREVLRVPGSIQADDQRVARIGASVTGRITDIKAVLGQDVKQGDVLAILNSTELAQSQLLYIKAAQRIDLLTKAVERARLLLEADVIGAAELQRREAELSAAQADLYTAKEQLQVLGMSEKSIAQIASSGQLRSYSNVDARISGTVISRKVNLGQVVQPAEELFIVADLSHVWAVAEVPEQQVELVQEGEDVDIEVPALSNRKFTGKLIFVGDVVNPVTRTVTVRTELENRDEALKPDMLVSMLVQSKPTEQIAVPRPAVVRENDKDHVFVQIAPNKFRLREVVLGTAYGEMVAVQTGLDEGELIISDGAFHINNERKRKELE
ncbi:efflux RND transporter periplasmic adaptor subunit [Methylobacillus flagellatus]|uniref:Secretion protein HlyD n=1 Tax=Methylobacillus flagellatus (strain ATCC 51484 / DSM 6875 / VKM B-1610 / KT) TaxID=265072 RepID=Q1H414_METFK|nr:efflux RND transporter periplasmic adaptor subunit [Methylobacillus flagellatus]ABE48773.1 secretion protein HlyD [Methylobacillus flagellatus KT]